MANSKKLLLRGSLMDYSNIKDLKQELWGKNGELRILINGISPSSNDSLLDLAKAKLETERDFSKLKTQKIAELRLNSEPVTIIKDKVKGLVADSKFDYEVAKAIWESRKANIDRIKTAIETIRSLISIAKSEINIR